VSDNAKVLVVTTTFPRHDGDDRPRFVLDLCKSLPGDYQQLVLAPSGPGSKIEGEVEGVRVRRFRYFFKRAESVAYGSGILANLKARPARWFLLPFFMLGLVLAIRKELREFRPDIVHAHWWMPAGFAAKIAIATTAGNFRLLITCHGTDYYVLGERFARLRRWVFAGADAIAMVSPAMREHAVARNLFEDKIHVAPMGVDLRSRFVPDKIKDRRGVLYVGRLVAGKGVDDLLNGWAATSAPVRSQGLTIIGDGNQRSAMQNLSESLGVTDSVTFLGPVTHDDLPAYYRQAALLVFPSAGKEGLGLVAIEAMGCDCPVLTSDTGSLADVVVEGQTGFVYPMGNATAMAQRLNELVAAEELCTEIGVQGGNAVRSRFDWAVTGQTYQDLYEGLLTIDESAGP